MTFPRQPVASGSNIGEAQHEQHHRAGFRSAEGALSTIREAIGGLNRSQAGGLVALFLTGEQERTSRVLFADKLACLGHRALERLDDSLLQSESTATHSETEPVLKD